MGDRDVVNKMKINKSNGKRQENIPEHMQGLGWLDR